MRILTVCKKEIKLKKELKKKNENYSYVLILRDSYHSRDGV